MDVGGAMVWSIETDDFRGLCHNEPYILINTIRNTINGGGKPNTPPRPEVVGGQQRTTTTPSTTTVGQGPTFGGSSGTTPKITTTTTTTTENVEPIDQCSAEGIYPSKSDCGDYVTCVSNGNGGFTQYVQKCPSGLAYDPKAKGCNYASAVPGCEGKVGREAVLYKSGSY